MNDCSMFRPEWFSVAMGNANPLLKAKASYVTDDVDKNGLSTRFAALAGLIEMGRERPFFI